MTPRRGALLRILGLGFGLAVAVGTIIGAGILRTPGDVAGWLPNPWWFVGIWVVGLVYATLGANALAELGTMLPRAGAQYAFARHTFGDYAGFVVGWIDWISTAASAAAIALVLAESASALLRGSTTLAQPIAIGLVIGFTAILLRGTRMSDRTQQITSLAKAIALLALVAACFVFAGRAAAPIVRAPSSAAHLSLFA